MEHRVIPTPGTSLLSAAQRVLSDGHERDAGQILSEAIEAGLLPPATKKITLYTSLYQYVQRSVAHRRRPLIVQNEATHAFRINHPIDDWPRIDVPPRRGWLTPAQIDALENRLRSPSTATAPEAFEKAVCDAFEAMGFVVVGSLPTEEADIPSSPRTTQATETVRMVKNMSLCRDHKPALVGREDHAGPDRLRTESPRR